MARCKYIVVEGPIGVGKSSLAKILANEFQARTVWSLSNAFTSAFKELDPVPQFRATAKLAGFLQAAPREPAIMV